MRDLTYLLLYQAVFKYFRMLNVEQFLILHWIFKCDSLDLTS